MTNRLEWEARNIAGLLDEGCGQEAAQRLREGIFNLRTGDAVNLVNFTNQLEQNGFGADLVVKPVLRQGYDRYGYPVQTQEYVVSVKTPVDQQLYGDRRMYPQGQFGNEQYGTDQWGRPLPQPRLDQWGNPVGPFSGPQYDQYGRRIPQQYDQFGQRFGRTYIQEDIAVIRNDGVYAVRSQPYYVQERPPQYNPRNPRLPIPW